MFNQGRSRIMRWIARVLLCSIGFLNAATAQTFVTPFDDGSYTAVPVSTTILYIHGITFAPGDPDTVVVSAVLSDGTAFYSVPVTRDADGHIEALGAPTSILNARGPEPGHGLLYYGPDHVLLFTYISESVLGEIPQGASSVTDVPLQGLGGSAPLGLVIKPKGFQGAGKLVFDTTSNAFYEADLVRNANFYDVANITLTSSSSQSKTLIGSIAYIDQTAPHVGSPAMMVAEGSGLYLYDVDAAGSPIDSTRRLFFDNHGEWSALARDPLTSDILAITNGQPSFYTFRGFPPTTITLTPTTLPAGLSGANYSGVQLAATGGADPYLYAIASGKLPAGLALSTDGSISGSPTEAGAFDFVVQATDTNGVIGKQDYSLVINAPLTITLMPSDLPDGTVGTPYDQNVVASGGTPPYRYSIASGALPDGIHFDNQSGALTGSPTTTGTYGFSITASDSSAGPGAPFSGTQSYTIAIRIPSPVASDGTLNIPRNGSLTSGLERFISGTATSIAIVSSPQHGALSVDGLIVTYTPNSAAVDDRFTYTASNSSGTSSVATITLLAPEPISPIPTLTATFRILLAFGFILVGAAFFGRANR